MILPIIKSEDYTQCHIVLSIEDAEAETETCTEMYVNKSYIDLPPHGQRMEQPLRYGVDKCSRKLLLSNVALCF